MTTSDPTAALIQAAAQRDADNFAAKMADSSLEAAVDIWLRRIARRKVSTAVRTRLVRAVERGDAAETKDVQLTRAALLRKAGLMSGRRQRTQRGSTPSGISSIFS